MSHQENQQPIIRATSSSSKPGSEPHAPAPAHAGAAPTHSSHTQESAAPAHAGTQDRAKGEGVEEEKERERETTEKKGKKEEPEKKTEDPGLAPIDFGAIVGTKKKKETDIDWSANAAPLEWLEEDHEKLDRLMAKRKGPITPIDVCGFPRTWDVREMREIMEKCGDLIDVILKEPGFVEVIVAESDAQHWYSAVEQVKVEGNRLRVLNRPKEADPDPDEIVQKKSKSAKDARGKEKKFESLPKRVKTAVYDDFV